jgi:hypothetical protein
VRITGTVVWKVGLPLAVLGTGIVGVLASGRDAFVVFIASAMAWVYVVPPLLIAGGALLFLHRSRKRREMSTAVTGPLLAVAGVLLVAAVLLAPANVVGSRVGRWRLDRAMAEIDRSVAPLEAYRAAHGRYPSTLAEAAAAGHPVPRPAFAARPGFYEVDENGTSFALNLEDPWSLFDHLFWSSETRSWSSTD